jgi:hypothetical protein
VAGESSRQEEVRREKEVANISKSSKSWKGYKTTAKGNGKAES